MNELIPKIFPDVKQVVSDQIQLLQCDKCPRTFTTKSGRTNHSKHCKGNGSQSFPDVQPSTSITLMANDDITLYNGDFFI